MADPALIISLAAEFVGKTAFKQAETATDKLNKSAKSLGRTLGLTFSGAAVLAYAKKSIKAAAEDQAAQASLTQTLKNLGFESKRDFYTEIPSIVQYHKDNWIW